MSSLSLFVERHRLAVSLAGVVLACGVIIPACGGGDIITKEDVATVLAFEQPPTEVTAGQSATFSARLREKPSGTVPGVSVSGGTLTYSIPFEQQSIATINAQTGVLTAATVQSAATQTVTVQAAASLPADIGFGQPPAVSTTVTIRSRVTQVAINQPTVSLRVGDPVATLAATASIAAGSPSTPTPVITWASSNTSLATVDAQGRVTAVAPTSSTAAVTITASSEGRTSAAIPVTILPALVPVIVVAPTSATVQVGATRQLAATVSNPGPGAVSVTWSLGTGAAQYVEVSPTGLVTGRAATPAGQTARVIATYTSGTTSISAGSDITVTALPPAVTVTPTTAALQVGERLNLAAVVTNPGPGAVTVSWSVAPAFAAYVEVTPTGVVTAKAPTPTNQPAEVTASYTTGTTTAQAVARITVTAPPPSLRVTATLTSIPVGGQSVVTAEIANPVGGMSIKWYVRSPEGIATGNSLGSTNTVTGTAVGTTYAVAELTAGALVLRDSIRITVTAPTQTGSRVRTIVLEPDNAEITARAGLSYRVLFYDANGVRTTVEAGGVLQFSSSNTQAATIDATTGRATGVGNGGSNPTTTITARYLLNGQEVATDQTPLIVYPPNAAHMGSIEISTAGNARSVKVGQDLVFQVIVRDVNGNQVTSGVNVTVTPTVDNPAANPFLRITTETGFGPGFFYRIRGVAATTPGTATNPLGGAVRITADGPGVHAEIFVHVTP